MRFALPLFEFSDDEVKQILADRQQRTRKFEDIMRYPLQQGLDIRRQQDKLLLEWMGSVQLAFEKTWESDLNLYDFFLVSQF